MRLSWWTFVRSRRTPTFIKRYAQRRLSIIPGDGTVSDDRQADFAENQQTRIPDSEQVLVPYIWVTELYTPTTVAHLLEGLAVLLTKARGASRGDPVSWIRTTRRSDARELPREMPLADVMPPGSMPGLESIIVDDLPDGIAFVRLRISILTSTITAVTAAFGVDEKRSRALQGIVNRDVASHSTPLVAIPLPVGFMTSSVRTDVTAVKRKAADEWRARLRRDTALWLSARLPGSLHRLAPGQLANIELLLTEHQRPWAESADGQGSLSAWTNVLHLGPGHEYWQSADVTGLRLREQSFGDCAPFLTLAGLRPEIAEDPPAGFGKYYNIGNYVLPLANHWALITFLHVLDEQLVITRDLAERLSSGRSPHALAQVQQQVIHMGLESDIVVGDILRYAQDQNAWHQFPSFSEVTSVASTQQPSPQVSLEQALQRRQMDNSNRIKQTEVDLRDLLNVSAQLTAAAENLRLQRRVLWLTIVSLIVGAIAAAAAVVALHISSK